MHAMQSAHDVMYGSSLRLVTPTDQTLAYSFWCLVRLPRGNVYLNSPNCEEDSMYSHALLRLARWARARAPCCRQWAHIRESQGAPNSAI